MEHEVDSQLEAGVPVQPSPVLMEAVQKVEQVVARLQSLQTTISGIHLSPVYSKQSRTSRGNSVGKEYVGPSGHRDASKRKPLKDYNGSRMEKLDQPLRTKAEWKQWSSPANQVHDVISEILMASQFAKQIATLVAEALQERPERTQQLGDVTEEPKKRASKDGKRRDIAFPSKAQVLKTMNAKAPPTNSFNKFKVAGFPSDTTVKLVPPAKITRTKDLPNKSKSKTKSASASHKRRSSSRSYSSMSSSPSTLSPGSPRLDMDSPEMKRGSNRLYSSPSASFREFSDDADDELSGPRRNSMIVTEIKGPTKPWKLTPTKGVLFSNPVYLSSPRKPSGARPSPVKIVPTTGRRNSWLTHQFPKSPEPVHREPTKSSGAASANPLSSSISKTTFKREGASKLAPKSTFTSEATKREYKSKKSSVVPPSRYVEMVPLDGPRNSSIVTMFDVLKVRSPPRLPAATPAQPNQLSRGPLSVDANTSVTNRSTVADGAYEKEEDLQCRAPHSHVESSPKLGILTNEQEKPSTHSKQVSPVESLDKENDQVPCAPAAVMFLRNISSGHTLNRSLSRRNSGASLIQRAKGWMSFQAVKQGRVRELERFQMARQLSSVKRSSPSVNQQGLALCSSDLFPSGRIIQLRPVHLQSLSETTLIGTTIP
uniref:Uncharacterized protein n=1 Tax=Physcomitrium patens TaxID=3218 RepID=A0A2K1K2F6_PHYPA|nr:hypothetical protein PHYPA_012431 [Physcomitrium patens]